MNALLFLASFGVLCTCEYHDKIDTSEMTTLGACEEIAGTWVPVPEPNSTPSYSQIIIAGRKMTYTLTVQDKHWLRIQPKVIGVLDDRIVIVSRSRHKGKTSTRYHFNVNLLSKRADGTLEILHCGTKFNDYLEKRLVQGTTLLTKVDEK